MSLGPPPRRLVSRRTALMSSTSLRAIAAALPAYVLSNEDAETISAAFRAVKEEVGNV